MFVDDRELAGVLEIAIDQNLTLRAPCKVVLVTERWDDAGVQMVGRRGARIVASIASLDARPLLWNAASLNARFFGLSPSGCDSVELSLIEFSTEIFFVSSEKDQFTFKSSWTIRTRSKLWSDKQ